MDDKDDKTNEGRWADARNKTRATDGNNAAAIKNNRPAVQNNRAWDTISEKKNIKIANVIVAIEMFSKFVLPTSYFAFNIIFFFILSGAAI